MTLACVFLKLHSFLYLIMKSHTHLLITKIFQEIKSCDFSLISLTYRFSHHPSTGPPRNLSFPMCWYCQDPFHQRQPKKISLFICSCVCFWHIMSGWFSFIVSKYLDLLYTPQHSLFKEAYRHSSILRELMIMCLF